MSDVWAKQRKEGYAAWRDIFESSLMGVWVGQYINLFVVWQAEFVSLPKHVHVFLTDFCPYRFCSDWWDLAFCMYIWG